MANERRDYLVAFCIGAVVGIGTAILLSSPGQKRLGRPVRRGSQRFRKRGRRLRRLAGR